MSDPVKIKIELTDQAKIVLAKLPALPSQMLMAIARTMDEENQLTIANIQANHLTGQGPFPPDQHRLGVRTNRLRSSVSSSAPVINGNQVDSSIGSNVVYAAIHEFGGRINKQARQAKVRLRLDARGALVRQAGHAHLAVFAGKQHKRAKEMDVTIGAHAIEMPERAPFRTGIQERSKNYARSISRAIVGVWGDLNKS